MRAIYINLDRSTERREWMEAQARSLGISIERFAAVDGTTLERNPFPDISLGAVGCFLSHRAVWSTVAEGKERFVLVLEDDAHLSPEIPKFLSDESWIPDDADIIHAERTQTLVTVSGRVRYAMGRKLVRTLGGGTGTGCYVISRACAAKLLIDLKTIDVEFDQILFNRSLPELAIYKLLPALSIQDKLTCSPSFGLTIEREEETQVQSHALSPGAKLAREARRLGRQLLGLLPSKTRRVRVGFR